MLTLVDTSIWIEYFRSGNNSEKLDFLIDENIVVINDLILAEIVPFLKVRNQRRVIDLLHNIKKLKLSIDWEQIIDFQYQCLKTGLNGIGIPDLIVAQNAIQNGAEIYSHDHHFRRMKDILNLHLAD